VFDVKSKITKEILDNTTFRTLNYNKWTISGDEKHVMIIHDAITVFRYSSIAKYTVVSLEEKRFSPLIKIGRVGSSLNHVAESQDLLQHAEFVRNEDGGMGVIFVADNDIYHQPSLDSSVVHQVTSSGVSGTVYNGVADWLYEEEILGQSHTTYVSNDGTKLAYISFNDSRVEEHVLHKIGKTRNKETELKFRYPRAGSTNPSASIFVKNLNKQGTGDVVRVAPPKEVFNQEHYICGVSWVGGGVISVLYQNRPQNASHHALCSPPDYDCNKIHAEKSETGWVENRGLPLFNADLTEMMLIESVDLGDDVGRFAQVVRGVVSGQDNIPLTTVTHAQAEVTKILSWDRKNNFIYYVSTLVNDPGVRHLLRKRLSGPEDKTECLTCLPVNNNNISAQCVRGVQSCEYNEIIISPENNAYVQHCLGPDVPSVHIISLPDNNCLQTLDTNNHIHSQIARSSMPRYHELSVELSNIGAARVKLTLPPVLRETEDYKFPLLVNIYGGPGTQTVSEKWSVSWDTFLASQRNFIVASIDVRGTGYQGDLFKHAVYGHLGEHEAEDTLAVIKYLSDNIKYIDSDKMCVWGWSYGGYVAGMMMAEDRESLLSCGISVSPVTQWQHYDTAYTERYMGQPTSHDGWKAYSSSSVTSRAHKIESGKLMLIHGTQDDNVHIEHSMTLSRVLVENDIIFRQQIYPDESHGLFGVTRHLYETMEAFLDEIYGPITDYFENDYYLAAAKLLEEYGEQFSR